MPYHLVLFFTYGVSLQTWDKMGMFHREVALYQKLLEMGVQISFITYGTNDRRYRNDLPGIGIYDNRLRLPISLYARLMPFLHMKVLRTADVYKTNQFKGGEFAELATRIWRKPLIARAGYDWLEFVKKHENVDESTLQRVQYSEQRLITNAPMIVVTTKRHVNQIRSTYSKKHIRIHPNYVLTDNFTPVKTTKLYDFVFVGRIDPQKNISMLLDTMRQLEGRRLLLIGQGELAESLKQEYADLSDRVIWYGAAPHEDLPRLIQQARIYILPSHHEGHPKALIEAMSCGMPVVGTDVPGIQDIIEHQKTGWLCEKTIDSLASALDHILNDETLQQSLGQHARDFALENYSLDKIAHLEVAAIKLATKLN